MCGVRSQGTTSACNNGSAVLLLKLRQPLLLLCNRHSPLMMLSFQLEGGQILAQNKMMAIQTVQQSLAYRSVPDQGLVGVCAAGADWSCQH